VVIRHARLVLLVPQLDVRRRQPRDQIADAFSLLGHGRQYTSPAD